MAEKKLSLPEAAATGDTRAALEAMRDKLASEMEFAEAAIVAQISGQLVKVLAALDALPAIEKSRVDELRKRREDRVSKARSSAPPNRQKRQRGS